MAEDLLFNTIEKLIGKLGSMVVESWNMRDDLAKLVEKMSEIKAVVLDAEEQQSNNHQVQLWLEKLKDALHDADDLFDDFNTEELRRQVMTNDKKAKRFRIFFSSSNQLLFSFKMAGKIKELRKQIEALNVDKINFYFTNRTPEQRVFKQRETHSFVRAEEVIGREEEKKELLEMLFDTSFNVKDNVSIISIIGVGGLGKTTLAQVVYGDKKVQQHFELMKWVCVSDDFDVKGIASKIIRSNTNVEMDEVQLELRKKVEGKRYLFVLDDIWNENRDLWLQLMTLLKDGAKGSKIIITTRSEQVAKISGSSSILSLEGLDEKQSWRLFGRLAFENEKDSENENLVSIGKEIVKKCSGVPLAIRSIGSLMYSSMQTEEDWLTFKNKDLMKIDEQGDNKIFQIIKLSYDHLPFHLKKCFAFCSLFPKDFLIEKKMLIRLWIAQGFVQSSDENVSLEDIGEKYFMDFVHKSLFQNITKEQLMFEDIIHFQMHDIVHAVASFITRNDYLILNEVRQHIDKQTRHVSFGFGLVESRQVLGASKLRTFLLLQQRDERKFYRSSIELPPCNSILSSSKRFRVLNFTCPMSMKIPSCIGRMKHIRYLGLSGIFEELPSSITELINLETLLLNYCVKLRELPKDLWKLVSLRHLELYGCGSLTCMPRGIGKMTNLQTLTRFLIDGTSKDSAGASELRGLNNLRGGLEIKGLELLRHCPTEAKHMNLIGKPHLHALFLNWNEQIVDDLEKDDIILQDIVMHSNIKALKICGFGGVTMSSLVNLDKLIIYQCKRLKYLELAPLHVKYIHLWDLPLLQWIVNNNNNGDNSSTFCASLTEIFLFRLINLKGWCRCSEEEMSEGCCHQFKSLEKLQIRNCLILTSIPQHIDIKKIELSSVRAKILQQAVTHSKVEFLDVKCIFHLKSLCGVLQHLTRVCELSISDCEQLDPCNDEDDHYSMKWKELANLKVLTFDKIPKMKYLPEGLQHITTLHTLRITYCVNLTSIPEWATSLQVLDIYGCPMVTSAFSGGR